MYPSVSDFKDFMAITVDSYDDIITNCLNAGIDYVEDFLKRNLSGEDKTKTSEVHYNIFGDYSKYHFRTKFGDPKKEGLILDIYDLDNNKTASKITPYIVGNGRVMFTSDLSLSQIDRVEITYKYGGDKIEVVNQAILLFAINFALNSKIPALINRQRLAERLGDYNVEYAPNTGINLKRLEAMIIRFRYFGSL